MHRWLAAALIAIFAAGAAAAQEAPALSEAQFRKLDGFLDSIGAREEFPPPTAQNLGLTDDANLALPVVIVKTDNHQVYFARSQFNHNDYVVWLRAKDNAASYMFSTHPDLKLIRALYLKENEFPQPMDTAASQVQALYRDALIALGKDVDKSKPH